LSTYTLSYFYLRCIRSFFQLTWREVFPWKVLSKILAISMLVGVFVSPINIYIQGPNYVKLILGCVLYFPSIFILFIKFNLIQKEDIDFIKHYILKTKNLFYYEKKRVIT